MNGISDEEASDIAESESSPPSTPSSQNPMPLGKTIDLHYSTLET